MITEHFGGKDARRRSELTPEILATEIARTLSEAVLSGNISRLLTLTSAGIFLGTYPELIPNTTGIASVSPFDGIRAFADLREIVAFGPRPSGWRAIEPCSAFCPSRTP
jgi:hypothetical protein